VQSGSCGPPGSQPYADGRGEWKEDLNASRALLVLEHNIKKMVAIPAPNVA